MGADDDAVAGFQADQRLENRRGGRVGGRDDRADHADRLGDLDGAVDLVLLDHAAGLGVAVGVVDVFRGKVVLDHLVLDNAHACFLHCHLGKRKSFTARGGGSREENRVYLFLTVGGKFLLRRLDAGKRFFKGFYALYDRILFCTHNIHLLNQLFKANQKDISRWLHR